MRIITPPTFKCNKCKKKFNTDIQDFGSPEVYYESRNMGNEIQFVWNYENECENCENSIEITIEGYEYPEGFFNYEETTSEGCLIIDKATLETEHSE